MRSVHSDRHLILTAAVHAPRNRLFPCVSFAEAELPLLGQTHPTVDLFHVFRLQAKELGLASATEFRSQQIFPCVLSTGVPRRALRRDDRSVQQLFHAFPLQYARIVEYAVVSSARNRWFPCVPFTHRLCGRNLQQAVFMRSVHRS